MNYKASSYYVGGNTAKGFVNFLPSNVRNFNHVIILNHPSETLKTTVIQNAIEHYKKDHEVEVLLSALGGNFLDGVIVRGKSFAVVNDTISTQGLSGAIEMDLNLFLAEEIPRNEKFTEAKNNFDTATEEAYENFSIGLELHDDLEEIYINQMDFEKADRLTENFIKKLLENVDKQDAKGKVLDRLFGTNTKDGVVNIVPDLLKGQSKNYYIKGRAGTGKSTFMKKIKNACLEHGFDVELYHCSFDPNSIDMVIVRELDFCIFDSTDPHEFFPEHEKDEIVDLYQELVTPGTDEKFAIEIDKLNRDYKAYMKKGIVHLRDAGAYLEQVEQQFVFNEQEVDRITNFILEKIVQ
ncbi:hypothetical protein GMD78_11820 [Ornithinibacillus sp. L9]|uniref:Nucleotide kinase n=1 Tax=Ornithinibacillus caprae TaxID=2678566 RepID=A0A6N8FIJ6_9BACI|nr:hypothetical protein [Ornithinibacillus caprae]MUK89061.1 hypothetical protein [Ornithinibacillus caprae]